MKKTLLLLASAALLLVGCAKEQLSNGLEGELTKVTFTASLDNGVATKAVDDGDGAAASVNRCIMEIYYGDELFARQIEKVTDKHATFTAQVVSNRTYKVAFWADCVDDATTPTGLAADKYYTTNAGLTAIALKGTYAGNDDARDAFFHVDNYTVAQAGRSFGTTEAPIRLKRPFAQMNVITTDWNVVTTVDALKPEKVNVTLKNALVNFNAVTGEASGSETLTYEASVYTAPAPLASALANEKTLSMDYLFASDTKALIDIDWKAKKTGDTDVAHAFAAVPYQRNYRTNIKGALLTTTGQWTVEVYPIWETDTNGDFDYAYTSVFDIQGANDFVAQNQDKKEISVTFSTQPNDAGDPSQGSDEHPINAIVTSLLKEGATYNIDVASTTDVLYVGDYDYTTTATGTTYHYDVVLEKTSEKTNAAAVNLVVTDNLYIGKLVVNSPSKSVSINGQTLVSGHSYHIDNLVVEEVSLHTVIIEKGMSVENLTMVKGGLEIHGTVHNAIVPEEHGTIAVRDCENLNEELVYNVLKDHIAEGYVGVKGRTTEGLWDIIPAVCKIGSTCYGSLTDAVAAVQEGETIALVKDIENATGIAINTGKTFTIDFNGHKYIVNKPGAGSTGTQTNAFQLLKGQTITFKNGTIEAAEDNLSLAVAPAKNIMRMFQSYANVYFEDMTIDCTNLYGAYAANEFACGAVSMTGNTSIFAKEGAKSINVDTWKDAYPEGAAVTINATGTIGDIYLYAEGTGEEYTKSSLTIKKGAFASITDDGSEDWTAAVSGGTFTADPTKYLAPKCEVVLGGDGLYYVNKIYDCTATIELPNGEVKEFNSGENNSGVMDAINYLEFTLYNEFPAADYPGYVPVIKMHKDDVVWNTHVKTSNPSKYGSCTYQLGYTSVLDGQGHTLTSKMNVPSGYKVSTTGLIKLMSGANVTIRNITLKASNADLYDIDVVNGSTATLENVVLGQANSWAIVNNKSTIYYNNVMFPSNRQYDGTSTAVADIFLAGGPYKFNCKATTTAKIGTSFIMSTNSIGNRVDNANWETGAICYCTNDFVFHIASEVPETEEVTAAIPSTTYEKSISYCGDDGLKNLFKVMALSGSNYESIVVYKTSSATKQLSKGKSIVVTFEGDAVYNNNFTAPSGCHIEASEPVSKTITYTSVAD